MSNSARPLTAPDYWDLLVSNLRELIVVIDQVAYNREDLHACHDCGDLFVDPFELSDSTCSICQSAAASEEDYSSFTWQAPS